MAVDELVAFRKAWRNAYPRSGTFVYAIQAGEGGPIKIGTAVRPWVRLATLQTANSARLRGLTAWGGSQAEEAALHKLFAADRLEGEWFKPSPTLIGLVEWLGSPPNCEFFKPEDCLAHDMASPTWSPGTCQACGIQLFER